MKLDEIKEFAKEFKRGVLGENSSELMCFVVCAPLESLLELNGVKCSLKELSFPDSNHFVIQLENENILDPTADQFGLNDVYVGPMPCLLYTSPSPRDRG